MVKDYLLLFEERVSTDSYKNAKMAALDHKAVSPEAIALREDLLPELEEVLRASKTGRSRAPSASERAGQVSTLDALLADLIKGTANTEAHGFVFRSFNRQAFSLEGCLATDRAYVWIFDAMKVLKLIDVRLGFQEYDDFDGERYVAKRKATRLRATPALLKRAIEKGITTEDFDTHYQRCQLANSNPVVIKNSKHESMPLSDVALRDPDALQIAIEEVERINAIYARHEFEDMPKPFVRRVFNNGNKPGFELNKGGRLYTDFQKLPSATRHQFLINGEPVVELDIRSSHLTILYHLTKTPLPEGDLYEILGLPREVIKGMIAAMMGRGSCHIARWTKPFKESLAKALDVSEFEPKDLGVHHRAPDLSAAIAEQRPPLKQLSDDLNWADLQYLESQVLIRTILELGEEHNIPALPVHDALIVAEKHAGFAQERFSEVFEEVIGGPAKIVLH